jgi:outer membrane protein assembly factor BamA
VRSVTIKENNLYETEEIEKILSIRETNVFSYVEIDAACDRIIYFYGHFGYINTSIHVNKKADLASDKIDIVF